MAGINLYEHQIDAVNRMKNGCILCGRVGLGKSRTALAYYYVCNDGVLGTDEYVCMGDPPKDLYIITTARKRDTLEWEAELSPFLLSTSKNHLYYHTVVIDSWNNIKKYKDVHSAFFIFDEQRVVGSGAWVKAFLNIARKNQWILLSATPGDTWSDYIPVFIANGFYKNKSEFLREHAVYSRFSKFPKIEKYINTGKLIKLKNSLLVDFNIPKNVDNSPSQKNAVVNMERSLCHEDVFVSYDIPTYKEVSKNRWNPYKNEPIINANELCLVWRKIVNSDESRQVAVLEIFENHPKVIIFYNFDYELEILKNLGYGSNVEIAEWNGHKHQHIPKCYSWVYLVQYTAGCEGWNCIETDTIIFYSQNYSYKVMQQAQGRINRLNSPFQKLFYYHLKSQSGIDLAISRTLKQKQNFNAGKYAERWT